MARDGAETGVEISLWHMDRDEQHRFDVCRFYHRLLTVDEEEGGEGESAYELRVMGAGAAGGFQEMVDLAKRKEHKKRRLGTVRVVLTGGAQRSAEAEDAVVMAAGIYKTVMPAVRPSFEWLQASTNEPAAKTSSLIDTSTGQVIAADDASCPLTTYIEVAGARIPFSKDDMSSCRKLIVDGIDAESSGENGTDDDAKLKVLFFAPASSLTLEMNLTAPCMVSGPFNKAKGYAL